MFVQEHKGNLRAALDQCSVREPDLELVATDGRRVFGHRFADYSHFITFPKNVFCVIILPACVLLFLLLTYYVPFRSVLGIFSPLLVDLFSHTPCCQMATIVFPDTSSEILSHLLNMLYTGEDFNHKGYRVLC